MAWSPSAALRRLWSIPEVADPARRQEVRLLFGVTRPQIVIYLAAAPIFFVPGVSVEPAVIPSAVLLAAGSLAFFAALAFAHRGQVAVASWIVICTALATQMGSIAMIGGLQGALAGSLLLSVLIAGILRGVVAAGVTAGISFAFLTALALAERAGIAPFILPLPPPGAAFVTITAVLAIGVALLALYVHELRIAAAATKASLEQARVADQRLADLVRQAPDGFLVLDAEGRVLEMNPAVERMSGYQAAELVGRKLLDLPGISSDGARSELAEGFGRTVQGGEGGVVVDLVRRDGSPFVIETRSRIVERAGQAPLVHVVVRDVTDRVRAERERARLEADLRDARRMEMVGRLAGGIAHDFRNLLTPILGNAAILEWAPGSDGAETRELAHEIGAAAQRASDLTGQLLAFARRQRVEARNLPLDDVLCEIEPILRRLVREDIRLEWELAANLPAIRADRSQFEQVVVNLVANARDAMPDGGMMTIATSSAESGADERAADPGSRGGRFVVLSVRDTGVGMTDEVREKIFDPFFTTKELGSGIGLGLATVHGIVAQAGGHIRVESQVGQGTAIHVFLPAAEGPPDDVRPPSQPVVALPQGALALVVDDSEGSRSVTARILRGAGLEVVEARDGDEALHVTDGLRRPLDLLVTDVVMPGVQGPELARRILARHPQARVVLVSGYSDQANMEAARLPRETRFLAKPFTPAVLVAKAAEALARDSVPRDPVPGT